jgi:hypothetical protein
LSDVRPFLDFVQRNLPNSLSPDSPGISIRPLPGISAAAGMTSQLAFTPPHTSSATAGGGGGGGSLREVPPGPVSGLPPWWDIAAWIDILSGQAVANPPKAELSAPIPSPVSPAPVSAPAVSPALVSAPAVSPAPVSAPAVSAPAVSATQPISPRADGQSTSTEPTPVPRGGSAGSSGASTGGGPSAGAGGSSVAASDSGSSASSGSGSGTGSVERINPIRIPKNPAPKPKPPNTGSANSRLNDVAEQAD